MRKNGPHLCFLFARPPHLQNLSCLFFIFINLNLMSRKVQREWYPKFPTCVAQSCLSISVQGTTEMRSILKNVFFRANISCSSKIELPYFTVDFYPKVCIYCGVTGTSRTLGNSVEHYPKCLKCAGKPDVVRRKRKALGAADLSKKKRNKRCCNCWNITTCCKNV